MDIRVVDRYKGINHSPLSSTVIGATPVIA